MLISRFERRFAWGRILAALCLQLYCACAPADGATEDLGELMAEQDAGAPEELEDKASTGMLWRPDGTKLRLASYNVRNDSVFKGARKDAFARIAPAVDADVWCMQEVSYGNAPAPASEGEAWRARMQQITGRNWNYAWDREGRYVLSKYPVRWNKALGHRVHASWIDSPGADLVVVNVHLAPGGKDRETAREGQARTAAKFIDDVQRGAYRTSDGRTIPRDATVVACGDFNSGPSAKTYSIFRSTTKPLTDVRPTHLGASESEATHGSVKFSGGRASFEGSRIDYVLARGALVPFRGFILNTLFLSPLQLQKAGNLRRTDVAITPNDPVDTNNGRVAVDHLPIIVDFR